MSPFFLLSSVSTRFQRHPGGSVPLPPGARDPTWQTVRFPNRLSIRRRRGRALQWVHTYTVYDNVHNRTICASDLSCEGGQLYWVVFNEVVASCSAEQQAIASFSDRVWYLKKKKRWRDSFAWLAFLTLDIFHSCYFYLSAHLFAASFSRGLGGRLAKCTDILFTSLWGF